MKQLNELAVLVDEQLRKLNFPDRPDGLYEPIRYTLNLEGKRMRPALVLAACEMFGGSADQAMQGALGIELFHNFTLLHDDIMDEAELRRGQPSVYQKFGRNTAILCGDVMMVRAYGLVADNEGSNAVHIMRLFNKTAEEVCVGQQYDMEFEERIDVTLSEYLKMIELKTAVLLGCSLQTGALAANASQEDAQHLYEFGRSLGIAFQLQDDVLDTYGDPQKFGKKVGGDILRNKKTFLLVCALEKANEDQRRKLLSLLENEVPSSLSDASTPQTTVLEKERSASVSKIEAVKSIYDQLAVRQVCEQRMDAYHQKAMKHLDAISDEQATSNGKALLGNLAAELMQRQY